MSFVARSGNLSSHLKAFSQTVSSQLNPILPPLVQAVDKCPVVPGVEYQTGNSLLATVPSTRGVAITSGIAASTQVRFAHTDIRVPDFSEYRKNSVQSPYTKKRDSDNERRAYTYLVVAGGGMAGAFAAKSIVTMFVSNMSASADVLALAKIEVKLNDIPEGKNVAFKWRGRPLFVRHRTAAEIEQEQKVDLATLRDPQHDSDRAQRPEWLILLGVCTHLGCVPIANAGDFGGYYCPCHGSHYDASGRIRKGPAPLNLEIPEHVFVDDSTLVVG